VIIPDINLLIYIHDESNRFHKQTRIWWESVMEKQLLIGLPLVCVLGFVRLLSNPRVTENPGNPAVLMTIMNHILHQPNVSLVAPGIRHLTIMTDLFTQSGATGKLTTDIHLAALAMEHKAQLASNDADFSRFPDLNWINPLN
jgi:toxin-antitoxin system PIN domain toxin